MTSDANGRPLDVVTAMRLLGQRGSRRIPTGARPGRSSCTSNIPSVESELFTGRLTPILSGSYEGKTDDHRGVHGRPVYRLLTDVLHARLASNGGAWTASMVP